MRRQLREELVKNGATDDLRGLVDELGREFTPADVAAAALSLLRRPSRQETSPPEIEKDLTELSGPRDFNRERRRSGLDATEERMRVGRRPTNRGMAKIYFGIGRDAGVSPRDMVGAIANETGIPGQDIGVVDLTDRFALVEVPSGAAEHVIEAMQGVRIRGRKVMVRADRPPLRSAGSIGRLPQTVR
jgi:ATP-dependent RNA helicase DeaD